MGRYCTARRKAVCPNEGFRNQLRNYENSSLPGTLSQKLRQQCRLYDELREQDLDEVQRVLQSDVVRASVSLPEVRAERNALQSVRDAMLGRSAADPPVRFGRGHSAGDVGLGWLVRSTSLAQPPQQSQDDGTEG